MDQSEHVAKFVNCLLFKSFQQYRIIRFDAISFITQPVYGSYPYGPLCLPENIGQDRDEQVNATVPGF
jgi:hypothetical protein